MIRLYRSPNGGAWFLGRDPGTGFAFVRHKANVSSGGKVTDIAIGAFLSNPIHPEQEALLLLIGTLVPDVREGMPHHESLSSKKRCCQGPEL